ncbi:hypothetical protein GcM3_200051 [Golovinomyces cichoracearum]|uniref:DUF3824 domain-containing protein n=1 Tax=Golovinomyces cichoracearum TaxID=62708 RepID=A0A420HDU3_9PEZI|nr:hypothetical protein GcM3_200051 [Golovinomyces cichoracearum]
MPTGDEYEIPYQRRSYPNQQQGEHHGYSNHQGTSSRTPYPDFESTNGPKNQDVPSYPAYEPSDYSVEEVRREFSPPRTGPSYRIRSDRNSIKYHNGAIIDRIPLYKDDESDTDTRSLYHESHTSQRRRKSISRRRSKSRRRSLSQNEIALAAIGGAALAVSGKEIWDRSKSGKRPVQSNLLHSAAIGAAGAFAAYEGTEIYKKKVSKKHSKHKKLHRSSKYQEDDRQKYDEPRNREDMKQYRSRSSHRSVSSDDQKDIRKRLDFDGIDSKRRTRSSDNASQLQKLAKTALLAGATEAFRVRKDPGDWTGDKGRRVLTAAISASTIDAVADGHGKSHILESILGGLASNHVINGSRHQDDKKSSRSKNHSRSRSRGSRKDGIDTLTEFFSTGLSSLAGKNTFEEPRSRSRVRTSRSRSRSSSRSIDRRRKHERSKSVTDFVRKGMSALGLHETMDHGKYRDTSPQPRSYHSGSSGNSSRSHYHGRRDINLRRKDSGDHGFSSARRESRSSRNHRHSIKNKY